MQEAFVPKKSIAIVTAAGSGVRLAANLPKALIQLCGKTIIERSVETLLDCSLFDSVIVTFPLNYESHFRNLFCQEQKKVLLCQGGATRQESVFNALRFAKENFELASDCIVAIHDAARCLVSTDTICAVYQAAKEYGAATAALPVNDSIKRAKNDNFIAQQIDRTGLWAVQTPQVFRYGIIWAAHSRAAAIKSFNSTDDTAMLEGESEVRLVTGKASNFKITEAQDLLLAETLINSKILG